MSVLESVKPISEHQQQEVISITHDYIARAATITASHLPVIDIKFDLKGRAAGMFCIRAGRKWIRYNPYLFSKYYTDNLAQTVPHEVAHYAIEHIYGHRVVRPHGQEWRSLMHAMGVAHAARTCDYDLAGIPVRKQNLHAYSCSCQQHQLTRRRHNKIEKEGVRYYCRLCQQLLIEHVP